jgi:hypothetical protein
VNGGMQILLVMILYYFGHQSLLERA